MPGGKLAQAVQAHHFTVVVYQLRDHTHRGKPGEPAQVHSSFRVSGAFTHSSLNCSEGENMPGARDVGRGARRIRQDPGCQCAVRR